MAYPMVRQRSAELSLDAFARAGGLHPELVRRLSVLGLLDPVVDPAGRWWFAPAQLATLARIRRLRTGLGLNYVAIGVVLDLLNRIEQLEGRTKEGDQAWT
jgi:DNA-binding transcriptional MerR regulator